MSDRYQHGKARRYECPCGATTFSVLHREPHHGPAVCGHCLASLDGKPFTIEDMGNYAEEVLRAARSE